MLERVWEIRTRKKGRGREGVREGGKEEEALNENGKKGRDWEGRN